MEAVRSEPRSGLHFEEKSLFCKHAVLDPVGLPFLFVPCKPETFAGASKRMHHD